MPEQNKTGALIAQLRRKKDMTQAQLAQQLDVTDRAVSRWETGVGMPDVTVLTALAQALSTTVDALLSGNTTDAQQAEAPLAVMTGLRTKKAIATLAPCASPAWRRVYVGVIAAAFFGLGTLSLFVYMGEQRIFLAALFMLGGAFSFEEAVFCGLYYLRTRAMCKGDFTPSRIVVAVQQCSMERKSTVLTIEHSKLLRVFATRAGFVLRWKTVISYVDGADEAAVHCLAQRAGISIQKARRGVVLATTAAGCLLCVAVAIVLGCVLLQYRAHWAREAALAPAVQSVPMLAEKDNAQDAPQFWGDTDVQYNVTADGVWFTIDGGKNATSPQFPTNGQAPAPLGEAIAVVARAEVLSALYQGATYCTVATSTNGGDSWDYEQLMDLGRPATWSRLVFFTAQDGYLALGTDFSMGGGEGKAGYVTHDGGVTWQQLSEFPLQNTSNRLCGFAMTQSGEAVLSLTTGQDESWPLIYVLQQDKKEWAKAELPWEECGLPYLHAVSELAVAHSGALTLTMTQAPYAEETASFSAPSAMGVWSADKT